MTRKKTTKSTTEATTTQAAASTINSSVHKKAAKPRSLKKSTVVANEAKVAVIEAQEATEALQKSLKEEVQKEVGLARKTPTKVYPVPVVEEKPLSLYDRFVGFLFWITTPFRSF